MCTEKKIEKKEKKKFHKEQEYAGERKNNKDAPHKAAAGGLLIEYSIL